MKALNTLKKHKYLFILILVITPLILIDITKNPIYLWDEGRNSLNALEMYFNNNFLVMHYDGEPDMWNTKPPLLIWLQTISMYIFGINELSIRIPSIIAAYITCIYLYFFSENFLKNKWIGILSAIILITTNGYIEIHGVKTGDFDALLTMFLTIASLSIFKYCCTNKISSLYTFFIALTLATLTKSIAGLLFTPAYFLLLLFNKKLIPTISTKHFYFGSLIFIASIAGYYGLREIYNPGYINAVFENELGGRLNSTVDGLETKNNLYYLENFFNEYNRFKYWIYLLPFALIINLFNPNKTLVKLSLYSFLLVFIHYLIITKASSKYYWYDTPWFPFLALIISIGISTSYKLLEKYKSLRLNFIPIALATLVAIIAYKDIYIKNTSPYNEYERNINLLSLFFQEARYGKREIEQNLVYCSSITRYNAMFYINQLNHIYNFNIQEKEWNKLVPGDIVVVGHDDEIKQNIENRYTVKILENNQQDYLYNGIKKYQIINIKY